MQAASHRDRYQASPIVQLNTGISVNMTVRCAGPGRSGGPLKMRTVSAQLRPIEPAPHRGRRRDRIWACYLGAGLLVLVVNPLRDSG
jgi:hypothetical protein